MTRQHTRICKSPMMECLEPRRLFAADITSGLVAHLDFDNASDLGRDVSASGTQHNGNVGPGIATAEGRFNGSAAFNGSSQVGFSSHNQLNLTTVSRRTTSLIFNASRVDRVQFLAEFGGGLRGNHIYLDGTDLVFAIWNTPPDETNLQYTEIRYGGIEADRWYHAAFTLDGGSSVTPDAFRGYVDGELVGIAQGSHLLRHSGDITLGANGNTHPIPSSEPSGLSGDDDLSPYRFQGRIDELRIYNRALDAEAIGAVSRDGADPPAPLSAGNDGFSTVGDTVLSRDAATGLLANDQTGDAGVAALASGPANGAVTVEPDGAFVYTPNAGFVGTDSFTYTLTDGAGADQRQVTGTATVTVTQPNRKPAAAGSLPGTSEDTQRTLTRAQVLAAVDDPDGDPLTLVGIAAAAAGIGGNVADHGDGTFTYTPPADASGSATLDVTVDDGSGPVTLTLGLQVSAVNDAPIANDDGIYSVGFQSALAVDAAGGLLQNDTDVEGLAGAALTLEAAPALGSVSLNPDGSFTYTPNAGASGTDTFTYRLTDADGADDVGTVTLQIAADQRAPLSAGNDGFSTVGDTVLSRDAATGLLANDQTGDAGVAALASGPANGAVTVEPDGAFVYTPNAGFVGTDSFTYTLTDGAGADQRRSSADVIVVVVTEPAPPEAEQSGGDAGDTGNDQPPAPPTPRPPATPSPDALRFIPAAPQPNADGGNALTRNPASATSLAGIGQSSGSFAIAEGTFVRLSSVAAPPAVEVLTARAAPTSSAPPRDGTSTDPFNLRFSDLEPLIEGVTAAPVDPQEREVNGRPEADHQSEPLRGVEAIANAGAAPTPGNELELADDQHPIEAPDALQANVPTTAP